MVAFINNNADSSSHDFLEDLPYANKLQENLGRENSLGRDPTQNNLYWDSLL